MSTAELNKTCFSFPGNTLLDQRRKRVLLAILIMKTVAFSEFISMPIVCNTKHHEKGVIFFITSLQHKKFAFVSNSGRPSRTKSLALKACVPIKSFLGVPKLSEDGMKITSPFHNLGRGFGKQF